MAIIVDKKNFDSGKYRIYRKDIDISRVPRKFRRFICNGEEEGGLYYFPRNDIQLLNWLGRPRPRPSSRWQSVNELNQREIYHVGVVSDRVTVEDCLELLKAIGCEKQFIACSVEKASLFFAELNKDDAVRLKGLCGISIVYPRGNLMFPMNTFY